MYVLIAGGGVVGSGLAARLVENRHDVVVVERDRALCEELAVRLGVQAVHGSATTIETLEEAGIAKADVAVAATPNDADNLAFALLAHNFRVPRIIARMRNPRYETAYRMAGVTRTLNVGDLFVNQLVLEIEQPALRHVASFGRGQASIVVATIPERAAVHGKTVREITQDKHFPAECVIAGIYRAEGEQFIFPRGPVALQSGDQVFLAADTDQLRRAAEILQRTH